MTASVLIAANAGSHRSRADVTASASTAGTGDIEVNINTTNITSPGEAMRLLDVIKDMINDYDWPAA